MVIVFGEEPTAAVAPVVVDVKRLVAFRSPTERRQRPVGISVIIVRYLFIIRLKIIASAGIQRQCKHHRHDKELQFSHHFFAL